jgi:hypothetical protein
MMMKVSLLLVALTATTCTQAFVVKPVTTKSKSTGMMLLAQQQQMRRSSRPGTTTTTSLQSFLADLFSPKNKVKEQKLPPPKPVFEKVVIDPDFRVAALFLTGGILLDLVPYAQLTIGPFLTLLGLLFLVQTFRIRFVFDEEGAFELKTASSSSSNGSSGDLGSSGENRIVGGANRWDTETIINYDFFPKGWIDGPVGPILVYFKETQTPSDSWDEGPGKLANDPDKIASGAAVPGQVHFFPAVCNTRQMRDEFDKRNCRKI